MSSSVPVKCPAHCSTGAPDRRRCSCACRGHNLVNADCCPTERGVARLNVTVVRGEGLYGDVGSKTDGYVKVFYGKEGATSPVIWNNDFPVWNFPAGRNGQSERQNVSLPLSEEESGGGVRESQGRREESREESGEGLLRVEVWDRDNRWNDDLLGKVSIIPTSGQNEKRYRLKHGSVIVRTTAVCSPFLQGALCEQYKATPPQSQRQSEYGGSWANQERGTRD
ncbi:hypothetical protein WMY93_031976 [Mugilogobius chulae]|uniref:C2 domain-containing protein n=1 Tax=Mugilogobius chulae TaxID=88201 RepID=A0AAW0MF96_9GOBI